MPQVFEQSLFFLFKGLALLFLLWLLLLLRLLRHSLFHLLSFSGNMALKQKTHKRIFTHLVRPTPCTSPRPPRPCRRSGTPGPTSSGTGKCLNKRQTTILFCYPVYIKTVFKPVWPTLALLKVRVDVLLPWPSFESTSTATKREAPSGQTGMRPEERERCSGEVIDRNKVFSSRRCNLP